MSFKFREQLMRLKGDVWYTQRHPLYKVLQVVSIQRSGPADYICLYGQLVKGQE